ncbi:MAG: HAD family acid phosphatase [Bacteroidota bacterium]
MIKESMYSMPAMWEAFLLEYYERGHYLDEISRISEQAAHFLATFPDRSEADAIILDIDETSLHSPWEFLSPSIPFDGPAFHAFLKRGEGEAIEPVLYLYNQAIAGGYTVFFITGRDKEKAVATKSNLQKAGYHTWQDVFFRQRRILPEDADEPWASAILYKTRIRKKLTEEGYRIICNIGDQHSDLRGGFAEKTYRLPNPFYTVL